MNKKIINEVLKILVIFNCCQRLFGLFIVRQLVFTSILVILCHGEPVQRRSFSAEFLFGCSTSSYQVEGAWNEDGKSESIWDYLTHTNPSVIKDLSNGDISADSYHNYKRDVEMMRELGLDAYRFSLSWTRILPTGFANEINPAGIKYYNNLIDELLKYNLTPMVTIYHWDLPQKLQELGGFENPLIIGWFEDYARVVYKNFGDRVKHWITFNEPKQICYEGYGSNTKAPILNSSAIGTYLCAKNLILAHANAYHAYKNDFKPTQGGQCGISINIDWMEPQPDSAEDEFAAEIMKQAEWALYADPIFSADGGFPKEFSERVADKSKEQGYPWSRLQEFTEKDKTWVRGSADFLGVNHYLYFVIASSKNKSQAGVPSLADDEVTYSQMFYIQLNNTSSWLTTVRSSIYNVLMDLKTRYNSPVMYITENGLAVNLGVNKMDDMRILYFRAILEGVLDALYAGVNLKGYMVWSLMDNFEWMQGYTDRFGLYEVDFESPARTRTPRKSAFVYKHIVRNRYIDHQYEPDSMNMTIDEGH